MKEQPKEHEKAKASHLQADKDRAAAKPADKVPANKAAPAASVGPGNLKPSNKAAEKPGAPSPVKQPVAAPAPAAMPKNQGRNDREEQKVAR